MYMVSRRLGILLLFFSRFYRISLFQRKIIRGYLKEFILEEETKWQQLLLQNNKVRGDKFSLFLRIIVAATRLYIRPCFRYIVFYFFFSSYGNKDNIFLWFYLLFFSNRLSTYWAWV